MRLAMHRVCGQLWCLVVALLWLPVVSFVAGRRSLAEGNIRAAAKVSINTILVQITIPLYHYYPR